MAAIKRRSNQEIVDAYKTTGNIWEAAKLLGICGQSVWERLQRMGYTLSSQKWSTEEIEELKSLAASCTLSEISQRLGRSYAAVACIASRNGFNTRYGNRKKRKKITSINEEQDRSAIEALKSGHDGVTRVARMIGVDVEVLVQNIQRQDMEFWKSYSMAHGSGKSTCIYCGSEFYGMNKKQASCSRKCKREHIEDASYFGGKRGATVGLSDGICQLCRLPKEKLSSHHVLGKENDPENDNLVALCSSCHQIVGMLGAKDFVDETKGWENLVIFVMARRMRKKNDDYAGIYASVEIEHLLHSEVMEGAIN